MRITRKVLISIAGDTFRKCAARLKISQRPRRRRSGNLSKLAKKSPSSSNDARQTIEAPKGEVQDEHQEATTTKELKAKSSKLTSKIKASDDAQETKEKLGRIKRKNSNLDKSIIPANAKGAPAEQKIPRKSPKDTEVASELRKKTIQIDERQVAPSLRSKISSPGHAADKSQDAVPAQTRAQTVPIENLSGVKTVVQIREPPKRAETAVVKSQDTVPAKTRKPERTTRKSTVAKKVQKRRLKTTEKVRSVRANGSSEGDASQPEFSKMDVQTIKAEQLDLARRYCCPCIDSCL